MNLKHPKLRLAFCCLLATALLPACGGGSSSSTGASPGGGNFEEGRAKGTAETLSLVLADLTALRTTLSASGAPAQTSRGTLGRSFALLEPRQQTALIAQLNRIIDQVTEAQEAADRPGAGAAQAEEAQTAAEQALAALRLVVVADTAARAGGGAAARTAAVEALMKIADATGDDATGDAEEQRAAIDAALQVALTAAEERVEELEAALERAAGSGEATIEGLTQQLAAARRERDNAQNNLNAELVQFGDNSVPRRSTAVVRLEPRMTGLTVTPYAGDSAATPPVPAYDPYGGYQANGWTATTTSSTNYRAVSDTFVEGSGRIELEPDPVLYSASDKSVISSDPHTGHFPARGLAIRDTFNALQTNNTYIGRDTTLEINRLRIQGRRPRASGYGNWHAEAFTTFRYDATNGITMGFGGDGVIFSDLERYSAIGGFQDLVSNADNPGNEPLDDAVTGDIEISFGAPSGRDPVGETGEPGTYYWRVQGRDPRELTAAQKADSAIRTKRAQAYADYELVLSNYAGRKDAASSRRYLRHAAYGLFTFIDNIFVTGTPFLGRMQVFHYGKNAFGPDRQVSGDVDDKITAKFEGRTHGFMVRGRDHEAPAKTGRVLFGEHIRIRGDVELTAHIGVTTGDANTTNKVTGTIDNLEHAIGTTGRWTDGPRYYRHFRSWDHDGDSNTDAVELNSIMQGTIALSADIDSNGHFTAGTATPDHFTEGRTFVEGTSAVPTAAVWAAGEFEGSLYGPLDNLEAAGTWWVPAATDNTGVEALIGSFGAVCTESSNGGAGACAAP